jgi:hypothetical protein
MFCICVKWLLPPGDNPIAVNKYYYYNIEKSAGRKVASGAIPRQIATQITLWMFLLNFVRTLDIRGNCL